MGWVVPETKIYVAIPYTGMEEDSFKFANEVTALLLNLKAYVYSPISSSHPIAATNMTANTFDMWIDLDMKFLEWCDEIYVIIPSGMRIDRILQSKGCLTEILWGVTNKKPIKYFIYNPVGKTLSPYEF